MAKNIFIYFDPIEPGIYYEQLANGIKELGAWAKVGQFMYYVKTDKPLDTVSSFLWSLMRPDDKLVVVSSSTNEFWSFNMAPEVLQHLQGLWLTKTEA
ncbi:hypothetical protein [Undibacterium terreum]|uniref:Uncharacterized protein n=1 Tax=Undibacterium terreum TaxID=1224302 RepID=A0A916ULG7_9BURK|nr:hypothetical protein [Undibacterium terreum]GGC76801.1 hypothetical protein GCM10011396_25000 [Undibacterium terreum]